MHQEVFCDLNPPQLEAVRHLNGPLLVLAGAGSGKTRVLTRRVANLVLNHAVNPRRILAVTFTNKATEEMRGRLRTMLRDDADRLWVSTFHAAGARILRQHAHHLGYSNSFVIYDDQDTKNVLKILVKQLGLDEKRFPPALFAKVIDDAKNALIRPSEFSAKSKIKDDPAAKIYTLYQEALFKANAMDFGDLIANPVLLFRSQPEILRSYQEGLQFVLVDEFQDTNQAQYELAKLLTAKHTNLFVVGDDDQSIYSFRGASVDYILNFEHDFAGARVIKLEQNYRSTSNILALSHAVIEKNKGRRAKKLWSDAPAGAQITAVVADDEQEEGAYLAQEISMLREQGESLESVAIFYRTNAQSRAIEEALINQAIPYRIFGGLKFYERKEVKDILAYLRLVANPRDDQAFLRCINTPPRGIGAQTIKNISQRALQAGASLYETAQKLAKDGSALEMFNKLIQTLNALALNSNLSELVHQTIELSDYAQTLKSSKDPQSIARLENLAELEAIARFQDDSSSEHLLNLQLFLERTALASGADLPEEHAEQKDPAKRTPMVTLMTLHLAKGLEFLYVFLTGLEEGLLPHHRTLGDVEAIEEERRLCYVGMTRAMRKLYLTRAYSRGLFGNGEMFGSFRSVSRFAFDIPPELLECVGREFCSDGYGIGLSEAMAQGEAFSDQSEQGEKPSRGVRRKSSWSVRTADDLE